MLAIISPAKRLDFETPLSTRKHSLPVFMNESKQLISGLKKKAPQDLASLMGISDNLAHLNVDRYHTWHTPFDTKNARPAVLAFNGDVYVGLEASTFGERDFTWAQNHLRILSGLHGVLKPLDLMQPYRLEMGTRLITRRGSDLYEFWGDKVTNELNMCLAESQRPILINLASNEYFNVVDPTGIDARIVTPRFLEKKNGRYMFVSFTAKKARGLMTSYFVRERVSTLKKLKAFDWNGYEFCEERSQGDDWVFTRD